MKTDKYRRVLFCTSFCFLLTVCVSISLPVDTKDGESEISTSNPYMKGSESGGHKKHNKKAIYPHKSTLKINTGALTDHIVEWDLSKKLMKQKQSLKEEATIRFNKTIALSNDDDMQQVCMKFCTEIKQFSSGFCKTDEGICICSMEGDDDSGEETLRVKLYKPKSDSNRFRNDLDSTNSEAQADAVNQVAETQRSGRNLMHDDEARFLGISSPGKPRSVSVRGRRPLVEIQERMCNFVSCMYQCPSHCESMCVQARECYCSCAEDVFYNYEEEYPFVG